MRRKSFKRSDQLEENQLLLREARKIVEALGKMFAPCCEVVLHDLTKPEQSIIAIETPISGRQVGEPTTELGRARIEDPSFPNVLQNYQNTFPDGRPAKSTSIGLKNSQGQFVAAICLNMDISLIGSVTNLLEQLTAVDKNSGPLRETLRARSHDELRDVIESFAASCNVQPRALTLAQRRQLIQHLNHAGLLQVRNGVAVAAGLLGITRGSIYNALKS